MALAFGFLLSGAVLSLVFARRPLLLRLLGPASVIAGSLAGIVASISSLVCGRTESLRIPWQIPYGSLNVALDPLSALFALAILVIASMAAIYGSGYLRHYEATKNMGVHWFFFNLLVASMLMVVLARNSMLFLLAWEVMSLSSFFLVLFEHEKDSVKNAGWVYFIATHIGTAFLLVMFILLGRQSGTLDFENFYVSDGPGSLAGLIFIFAVIGFGTKAGFMPFHVWLPEAHPAAPSHVSALMSGVMIKTGIYGLLRTLSFLGCPPPWWGWTLLCIGIVSGVVGVLFALAQNDIKRLLAYSSVENVGIITIGIGIGVLGVSYGHSVMAFLGFAGALIHVLNHAVFKSLLFFGAGSILTSTGTREIDRLGGLLKKMPYTGTVFLVGSAAICGLPPLNGFVSEFLIYVSAFEGITHKGVSGGLAIAGIMAIAALALVGGLAVACFSKAFGIVFLGEPRSKHIDDAGEINMPMRVPMFLLAALCGLMGLSAILALNVMPSITGILTSSLSATSQDNMALVSYRGVLKSVTIISLGFVSLMAFAALIRGWLMSRRVSPDVVTWDCGYQAPTSRMQYTGSSFVQPITKFFQTFLRTTRRLSPPDGFFPGSASFSSETKDFYREQVYKPTFSAMESWLSKFRQIQHGRLNLYIMYIVVALVVLFVWKLR